jgi:glyoxylase-like metal-dependent hydrolase (beta-lactamase superfamily II)/8-oxo-dGTP pyrophosphatase MutT (NUDIX family)
MAFAPDMYVFPGGRVDIGDADPSLVARSVRSPVEAAEALGGDLAPDVALAAHLAAIRELFEEAGVLLAETAAAAAQLAADRSALLDGTTTLPDLAARCDLRLRTDLLLPLSRWVTPPMLPRRFDTRFFATLLPDGIDASFEGGEVVAYAWLRPGAALEAMADGRISMWLPTSTTLQQLEHVRSIDEIRTRLSPAQLGDVTVDELLQHVTRIVMPAGGGVAGQPVNAYLVGRRRCVLIDPGDPTGPALDRALDFAAARGSSIDAVALTHVDPDHAAGAEAIAERLGIPVFTGPGGGRPLPYTVRELADLEPIGVGDIELRAVLTPGPRPDHVAYLAADGTFVLTGDLDGARGARSIHGPSDEVAWAVSLERLVSLAPAAGRLPGHSPRPDPV